MSRGPCCSAPPQCEFNCALWGPQASQPPLFYGGVLASFVGWISTALAVRNPPEIVNYVKFPVDYAQLRCANPPYNTNPLPNDFDESLGIPWDTPPWLRYFYVNNYCNFTMKKSAGGTESILPVQLYQCLKCLQ
jgi:hypothetical protein